MTASPSTFRDRIVDEADQLATKIDALRQFLRKDAFQNLSAANQILLQEQERVMTRYMEILLVRLALTA